MESSAKDLQEPLLCTMDTDINRSNATVLHDTNTSTTSCRIPTEQEGPVWFCCGIPVSNCVRQCEAVADTWHRSLAAAFMTLMLWVQFRVACTVPDAPIQMDTSLLIQIGSFGLAGVLFRIALTGQEATIVQLWPEVTTDGLLLIILLGYTTEAVWLMNLLTLSQCLHAAWNQWEQLQRPAASSCSCCDATPSSLDRTHHTRGCRPLRPLAGFRKLDEYDSDVEDSDEDDEHDDNQSATTSTTATDSETDDYCARTV